jgi:hypothetical protein
VNVNAVSSGGTVLIVSAWSGDYAMVKWLLLLHNNSNQVLDLDNKGSLLKTSVCGGKGPYTAKVWAQRKAAVCEQFEPFQRCVDLIENEERRRSKNSAAN